MKDIYLVFVTILCRISLDIATVNHAKTQDYCVLLLVVVLESLIIFGLLLSLVLLGQVFHNYQLKPVKRRFICVIASMCFAIDLMMFVALYNTIECKFRMLQVFKMINITVLPMLQGL